MTTANAWATALAHMEAKAAAAEQQRGVAEDRSRQAREDESRQERYARWRVDPAAFAAEALAWPAGRQLHGYQAKAMRTLARDRRLALRKLHGIGGTATAAIVVLWFALTREAAGVDWKVVTTASVWRQLKEYLWPEVHKWAKRLRWDLLGREPLVEGRELLDLHLKLSHGSAFAVASNDAAKIEGAHAEEILYVFDEAKSIPADTFDAAEGAFASGTAYALALSTPGEPSGRFYDLCRRGPGTEDWTHQHVTLEDAVAAGQVSQAWADARRRQWGLDSALYQNRVLGNFASSATDTVIPLSWVEAANERWRERFAEGWAPPCELSALGVDVARGGADRSVLARRYGDAVAPLEELSRTDTMAVAGQVAAILAGQGGRAVVDVIGIGAGVVDRLRELSGQQDVGGKVLDVDAFVAGGASALRDRSGEMGYANRRSAAWWGLREQLDPAFGSTLALPAEDLLVGDLTAPRWRVTSGAKIQVESKDDIRKRIGRSTDDGDAVVQACVTPEWEPPLPAAPEEIGSDDYWSAGGPSVLDEPWSDLVDAWGISEM